VSRVAVVTLAHGRHDHLVAQHRSLARGGRRPDRYVVVAMDDPGIGPETRDGLAREVVAVPRAPLGLPLAAARNVGVAHALADGADTVVLLDVDCLAGPDLVAAYDAACAAEPAVVWSGVVTYLPEPSPAGYPLERLDALDDPHPARPDPGVGGRLRGTDPDLFWSLSFAVSASAWRHGGGFCEEYVGYGGEDTDFGHAVVRAGLEHGVLGDARAYHQWHPVSRPPVEHLHDVLRNAALFHRRWGRWPMEGWLTAFEERGLAAYRDGRWVPSPTLEEVS
jgi:N-acetylglucosaminyl-diphospho-decaprenol L-rhamnosyltransferase